MSIRCLYDKYLNLILQLDLLAILDICGKNIKYVILDRLKIDEPIKDGNYSFAHIEYKSFSRFNFIASLDLLIV